MMPQVISCTFLTIHRSAIRLWAKVFSVASSGAFASFGRRTVLQPPIRLGGEERIAIGSDVFVGQGSWLEVQESDSSDIAIEIGDGTQIAGACTLSAARKITLGRSVLFARGVYVADHFHAFADLGRPVLAQGIDRIAAVRIGDGAWLGQNVVVGPGVTIGRGAVIGANAVVLDDIPDHTVAVGAPARVVRDLQATSARVG
jgi:acetyltransferase-like isoleucine patch superfamily enzyme